MFKVKESEMDGVVFYIVTVTSLGVTTDLFHIVDEKQAEEMAARLNKAVFPS